MAIPHFNYLMIYDYKCTSCSNVFEVWAKIADPGPGECPRCQAPDPEKVISAPAFALKGSGWYTTDYKRSSAPAAAPTSPSAAPEKAAETVKAAPVAGTGATDA